MLSRKQIAARYVLAALSGIALVLAVPPTAFAIAPHVATETADGSYTSTCAMCHRAHTAAGNVTWQDTQDTTHSALIVSPTSGTGDVGFCYVCHGAESVGSNTNVQTDFTATSHHSIDPSSSEYGPSPKQCSSCHDSHGSARNAAGQPYPALLRSRVPTSGADVYSGEAYCGTCHSTPRGRFDGVSVFEQTKHYSQIPTPTSGTNIRCDVCHSAHGSNIAPLLASQLTSPAVPTTLTVTANDRTFCYDCHVDASATYPGRAAYEVSSHGMTSAVVTVTADWASAETTRLAGECQNCHDPMGRSDGAGGVIPKLAEKAGAALCLTCHTVAGTASTDLASMSYPPTATPTELLASWTPATGTVTYSRLAAYSQDPTSTLPHDVVGPREFTVPGSAVGTIAAGDIDGDGKTDIVAALAGTSQLAVFSRDPLRGLTTRTGPGILSMPGSPSADLIAVGDFLGLGRAQIAVVDTSTKQLRLYRYDGSVLVQVGSTLTVGNGVSSIAAGDVTGSSAPDIVLTARDDDKLEVITDSSGSLVEQGSYDTSASPTGAAVGEVWPGNAKQDIVVLTGTDPGSVSIYDGAGVKQYSRALDGVAGSRPTAAAVGSVLPSAGPAAPNDVEIAVTLATDTDVSTLDVFVQQSGGGLAAPLTYQTGDRYVSGSVMTGDVDGDAHAEVVVGNAGRWAKDGTRQLPSIQVFRATSAGTTLDTAATTTLWAGGTELAGKAPSLAIADVGAGPSRHPWSVIPKAHVSTEVSPTPLHVECEDCHEVHESTSTVAAAPAAEGPIKGASGVSVQNVAPGSVVLTQKTSVQYEYELCFKCHSGWAPLDGRTDTALEFDTLNASVHAVEGSANVSANPGTYVSPWNNGSVMYCTDCHAAASGSVKGPHASEDAPILSRPYLGSSPADSGALCYKCHQFDVYFNGTADTGTAQSFFSNGGTKLHSLHSYGGGLGCAACHVGHGSTSVDHLVGSSVGYAANASGGTCTNACHPGGTSYTR